MIIVYTNDELTVKKLNSNFITQQATALLKDKYNIHTFNNEDFAQIQKDKLYTVAQANDLIEDIVRRATTKV